MQLVLSGGITELMRLLCSTFYEFQISFALCTVTTIYIIIHFIFIDILCSFGRLVIKNINEGI